MSNYVLKAVGADAPNKMKLLWDASFYSQQYIPDKNGVSHPDRINYGLNQAYPSIEACNAAERVGLPKFYRANEDGTPNATGNFIHQTTTGVSNYSDVGISPSQLDGASIIETTKEVQGFSLSLSLPALYKLKANKSGYEETYSVSVGIYYKDKADTSNTWHCLTPNETISSKPSRSEIIRTVTTHPNQLHLAEYKILVVRLTDSHTGDFDYADEIYIKELTEIIYEELAYPHTALLGVKIRATDQLSGSPPTITSLVQGLKVSVPTNLVGTEVTYTDAAGTYTSSYNRNGYSNPMGEMSTTKIWTDNPVWCLYDLLTNKRYGLADYYKIDESKLGLMRANFYLMAKYCDELIASSDAADPAGIITATGQKSDHIRPRFTLNMVIDQSKTAAEWIGAICAIMRASVFYSEGIFWLDIDRPKLMTQIFNMTSIKEYTQTGTSYRGIPNTFEVQWINPKASYEVDVFRLESDEFKNNQALEERKKALMLLGVTSFDQAKSLAKYALYSGMYRTKLITFKTHTAGLRSMVGDVVGVQHILSMTSNPINKFKIASIKRDENEYVEITAVEYDAQLYDKCDSTQDLGAWVSTDYSLLQIPQRTSCSGVVANSILEQDSTGAFQSVIEVFFDTPKNNSFWKAAEVYYSKAGSGVYSAPITVNSGYAKIYGLMEEGTYQIVVCSVFSSGKQAISDALSDTVNSPYTVVNVSFYTPNEYFLKGVTGLSIVNKANDGTFLGKDCQVKWNKPLATDAAVNNSATGTAGSTANDNWFKHYEVVINNVSFASEDTTKSNPIVGSIRRTAQVYDERFTYTSEMNYQDGEGNATRYFQIAVRAFDRVGRGSATKSIIAYNPPPEKLTPVTLTGFIKSFQVNFPPAKETDAIGYQIFASKDSTALGNDPEPFKVSDGTETSYQHFVSEGGLWFVVVAAYDSFGDDELNYSDVNSVPVSTLDPLDQVPPDEPVWDVAVTGLEEGEV